MAYTITIAGTDRSTDVLAQSVTIDDVVNDQANTCSFALVDNNSLGIPATDDEVIITLDSGTKIFGGYITKITTDKKMGQVAVRIQCIDYTYLLDRNLVHRSYEGETDLAIIEDIVSRYCAGFGITTTNASMGATIDKISFNYIQPSQALRKIAELTGRNWYIDYDKDIHYFPLTTAPAPFDIDDTTALYKDLSISQDASQLRNRVYVRGGTRLSDLTVYEEKGDGEKRTFTLPDKPHGVSLTVNGVSKSVGIKNVDQTGYDWYVNFQEKYVEQDAGGVVLGTGDTIAVSYQYDIPILVALEDTASIAANGEKEFAIFDKTISTTEAARDRASAELTDYANDLIEGSFITWTDGFKSGQYININLPEYDIDADYLVQRVRAKSMGAGQYEYTVSIASAKTLGIIKFFIELLEQNRNLIELDDNESVDELFMVTDSLLSDSLVDNLTTDSSGPYHTWAVGSETTPITTGRWDLSQWG